MSHTIEYNHLAIAVDMRGIWERFGEFAERHRAARLEGHLKEPVVYAVFTEAGSNNTSRIEYRHGRRVEVAARDWEVFTFGAHYEVIEKATGLAIHAHNGGVRFDASRTDTTPESYIRKYRATLDNTVSAHCSDLHSLVGMQLNIPYVRQEAEVEHPWLSVLREHGRATDSAGGTQVSLTLGTGSPDLLGSREDDLRADVSVVAWLCGKLTATQWAHVPRGSLDHIGQLAKEREGYRRFNRRRA